jgi:hypothetical protein
MVMASWGYWVGERGKEEAAIRPGIDIAEQGMVSSSSELRSKGAMDKGFGICYAPIDGFCSNCKVRVVCAHGRDASLHDGNANLPIS